MKKIISNNVLPKIFRVADQPLLIIDDFYSDPDSIRKRALEANYRPPPFGNFPGKTSFVGPEVQKELIEFVTEMATTYFSELLKFKIPIDLEGSECYYQIIDVPWDSVDEKFKVPHVDYRFKRGIVTIPALVYLNEPEQCSGGTAFFRHTPTGMYEIDSPAQFHSVYTSEESKWHMHNFVRMKYNRLIMYNGNLMHTALIGENAFGSTIGDCRLTQNIFLHMKI
tara:strand:+ start:5637 stop:6308 length:672 start_codon:yes stop_codon:yes gene_type:complete